MQRDRYSNIRLVILAFALIAILGAVITAVYLLSTNFESSDLQRPIQPIETSTPIETLKPDLPTKITVSQLTERLASYFLSNYLQPNPIAIVNCGINGICDIRESSRLPSNSWAMLGAAGMFKRTKDKIYLDLAIKLADRMSVEPTGSNDAFSLHQAFRAYEMTGEVKFLKFFIGRLPMAANHARRQLANGDLSKLHPMLIATLAYEMALGAHAFRHVDRKLDGRFVELFPALGAKLRGRKADEYEALSRNLLKAFDSREQKSKPLLEDENRVPRLTEWTCWKSWTLDALLDASKKPEDLDFIKQNLFYASFADPGSNKFNVLSLQQILPCLDIISRRAKPSGRHLSPDLAGIMTKFILPNWDRYEKPICTGDDGILAMNSQANGENRCSGNAKGISDYGWLLAILSNQQGELAYE